MKIHRKLDFNIDIYFDLDGYTDQVAASTQSKIHSIHNNGKLDQNALSEYLLFIEQAQIEIEDAGLVILEHNDSKSSETSKYYTLADIDQYESGNMKYVIFLRISDHVPQLSAEQRQWIRQRREATSNHFKVKWKVRSIVVNDRTFYSYDDAIEYVASQAKQYKIALSK